MDSNRLYVPEERLGGKAPGARLTGWRPSLPDRRNHASREELLRRVRTEFEELEGLKLTLAQAQRLFGLREDACVRVLNTLVREGLLCVQPDELYMRRQT